MKDLTKISKPFGMLKPKTQQRLKACFESGGVIELYYPDGWLFVRTPQWANELVYRAQPTPKPTLTPDTIDWSALKPEWLYVARDMSGLVHAYPNKPTLCDGYWEDADADGLEIDHRLLTIHTAGTCHWKDSLLERPAYTGVTDAEKASIEKHDRMHRILGPRTPSA